MIAKIWIKDLGIWLLGEYITTDIDYKNWFFIVDSNYSLWEIGEVAYFTDHEIIEWYK